jgi:hypothetical protein
MNTLSREPEIVAMANALRLTGNDTVQSIIAFCLNKIASWIKAHGPVRHIRDLEKLVCEKLNLVFYEIWSDDDLDKLIKDFVDEGDFIFAHLKKDLDEKTFATLIRRKLFNPKAEERYVAVIDCRGNKSPRRFFSRWHEIAHLLTLYRQMELPLHRSTVEKDPTEKLMDIIAGEVGFYRPMFEPVLADELERSGRLTFAVAESVRVNFCPDASFRATLNACAAHSTSPAILLEIGMGFKKTELRKLNSPQMDLLPVAPPKRQLRVLNSMPNPSARSISFQIPRYMRVPKNSILTTVFNASDDSSFVSAEAIENLHSWGSSDGSTLAHMSVCIQAQKVHDKVFAIVTPH